MKEIFYGKRIKDGRIITIWDVPIEESGLDCECVCEKCNVKLQACALDENKKKSNSPKRYFRHHNPKGGTDSGEWGCDAISSNESALHKLAKQIIADELKVCIPAQEIPLGKLKLELPEYIRNKIPNSYVIQEETVLNCDEVWVENRIENFRSDATIVSQGISYLIEIFVKHRTRNEKIEKIKKVGGYPTLEINLSCYADNPISEKDLRSLLIEESRLKKWIYYPNESEIIEEARKFFEELDIVKEYQKKLKEKDEIEIEFKRKYKEIFEPDSYKELLIKLVRRRYNADVFNDFQFCKDMKKRRENYVPFFINIPITGEVIIECDRRVWQGAIFDKFIYFRRKNKEVTVGNIVSWMKNRQEIFEIRNGFEDDLLINRIVENYLNYMLRLGFLSIPNSYHSSYKIQRNKSLKSPDEEYATALREVLKRIDKYSPEVDNLIRKELESLYFKTLE